MLGAYLGDMAAWTWEHDRNYFNEYLVSTKSKPSEMMYDLLIAFNSLYSKGHYGKWMYDSFTDVENRKGNLLRSVVFGWMYDDGITTQRMLDACLTFSDSESCCAAHLLSKAIFALRHGKTKEEASKVKYKKTIEEIANDNNYNKGVGALSVLAKAWKAFYSAIDFVSTIKAVVEMPGDRHLNCAIAGALADAMYDCKVILSPAKSHFFGSSIYGCNPQLFLPKAMLEVHSSGRTFNAKNEIGMYIPSTLWEKVKNPLEDVVINQTLHDNILKKYRFYLDDGLVYLVADEYYMAVARFKMVEVEFGKYKFKDFEKIHNLSYNQFLSLLKKYLPREDSFHTGSENDKNIPKEFYNPETKSTELFECYLDDVEYPEDEDISDDIYEGMTLMINKGIPVNFRPRKKYPVTVCDSYSGIEDNKPIAYIPEEESRKMFNLNLSRLEEGEKPSPFEATIIKISKDRYNKPLIKVSVSSAGYEYNLDSNYVQYAWILELDPLNIKGVRSDLWNKGLINYSTENTQIGIGLPMSKETVILIEKGDDKSTIYIMKRQLPSIDLTDGFMGYSISDVNDSMITLTNVIGPINVSNSLLRFADAPQIKQGVLTRVEYGAIEPFLDKIKPEFTEDPVNDLPF